MAAESSTAAASSRSGGGGASADSYIGSLISLTSKSEIRYEGILYNINTEESSIGLRNVRSFGTEGRKKDGPQVPPSDKIYEYILFRGSDIKSHYPRPTPPPTSLPTAPSGSLADHGSHSAQMGLPGSTFQSGLPLYQPGGNLNSWGPSPPNANGSGLAMPMYWQGFYGTPNGLPQLPQQSLLRPPPGLSLPPTMQQMQFSGFNSSLPTAGSSLPTANLPEYHSSLVPSSTGSSSLTSTSLPASTLSLNMPPLQPVSLSSETMINPLANKAPLTAISTSSPVPGLPSLAHLPTSVPDNAGVPLAVSKPVSIPGPTALPQQAISQSGTSVSVASGLVTESPTPLLITPGQLLHSGPATASAPQPLQTVQKDVEVVQVSSKPSAEPTVAAVTEAQPQILLLPPNSRAQKISRPVTKFTEDFDFTAMNEKFKKDEVWGHLGKSNKSQSKDKEANGSDIGEDDSQDEDVAELPKIEVKPVYNKDDFFDSLSCNALDNDPNNGRTRYSEQMKLDTETFGEFSRYRGGRGGRGPGRGGRFRGSYHGRGYGGYNSYAGRGRGRGNPLYIRPRNPNRFLLSASIAEKNSSLEFSWTSWDKVASDDYNGWAIAEESAPRPVKKKGLPKFAVIGIGASLAAVLGLFAYFSLSSKGYGIRLRSRFNALRGFSVPSFTDKDENKSEEVSDNVSLKDAQVPEENSSDVLDAFGQTETSFNAMKEQKLERIIVPFAVDSVQQEALLVLKKLKIIEDDARADELCTRREYARWLVRANSQLERSRKHRINSSAALSGSRITAFDDVGVEDPDFEFIQSLAEAGIVRSKLSDMNSGPNVNNVEDKGQVDFSPERFISRQDLVSWKAKIEYEVMPGIYEKMSRKNIGFLDVKEISSDALVELFLDILADEKSIVRGVFGYLRSPFLLFFPPQSSLAFPIPFLASIPHAYAKMNDYIIDALD
ncbi:UNVERIFIED_CONTAM: protein decapping 5 [Sesamum calycinum]|uniref:Protein decapping 5 n=1 Tax=Sesamum calycinum TaxID=2727403 RepID=A0AAW2QY30_9LAMI